MLLAKLSTASAAADEKDSREVLTLIIQQQSAPQHISQHDDDGQKKMGRYF